MKPIQTQHQRTDKQWQHGLHNILDKRLIEIRLKPATSCQLAHALPLRHMDIE